MSPMGSSRVTCLVESIWRGLLRAALRFDSWAADLAVRAHQVRAWTSARLAHDELRLAVEALLSWLERVLPQLRTVIGLARKLIAILATPPDGGSAFA